MEKAIDTQSGPVEFDATEAKYRLVEPNFLSPEECAALVHLTEEHGAIGDGYNGNPHPHTPTETFGGYTLATWTAGQPSYPPEHMTALRVILRARDRLKQHFGLRFLWLDYSQAVFRYPNEDSEQPEEEDFSHPWHLDNQADHVKHRTHTVILYLNDEFEGGLTRFKETDFGPFREVRPRAGTLVGFDVAHNPHAVSKLRKGKRFVLNMWFSTHWQIWNRHRKIVRDLR